MQPSNNDPGRTWADVGTTFIVQAFTEGERWHGAYDATRERTRIAAAIDTLTWCPPVGRLPLTPAQALEAIVPTLRLSDVTAVATNGCLTLPDGPERARYSVYGIEGHVGPHRFRVYLLHTSTDILTLAVDENVPGPAL